MSTLSINTSKFPRTRHLPFSPGVSSDDKTVKPGDMGRFVGQHLVVTEKMDGSNLCMTRDAVYARSHNGPPTHPSFDMAKALWAEIRDKIPANIEVFGEWLYAKHSIAYRGLPGYFMVFAVRGGDTWLSWEDTAAWAKLLGLPTVPVICEDLVVHRSSCLDQVTFDDVLGEAKIDRPRYAEETEGFVVRPVKKFVNWTENAAKWVRKDHVQTDDHWTTQAIVKNELAS